MLFRAISALALVAGTACHSAPASPGRCGGELATWPDALRPGQRLVLRHGWRIQSTADVSDPPELVSTSAYAPAGWYPARVPSTVVGTLVEDGLFGDPLVAMNLRTLPGMAYEVGEVFTSLEIPDDSPYRAPWWYRTEFDLPAELAGGKVWLTLDGVNYRADVWLNGQRVDTTGSIVGTYTSFELDVTCAARPGERNVLALRVSAPRVDDLAHNWIDWNPTPPDKNMGLWRDVWLRASGPVVIRDAQVRTVSLDLALDVARLEIAAELRNASDADASGVLRGSIGAIAFERAVTVRRGESVSVRFSAPEFPQLEVHHPALWWPAQYGPQNLHTLVLEFATDAAVSDRAQVRFGIREIASELTAAGHRLFSVNGRPLLVRGAGFARDLFFMDTPEREEREMSLVRDLGLNVLRFEGKFGSDHLLDLLDEQGVLVISGWACCDAWEQTPTWNDDQRRVAEASMRSMALRLRNRPSPLTWLYGSDGPPCPEVEAMYLRVLDETRWPNPAQSSAKEWSTPLTGPSGLKMLGPYQWVPPSYWLGDRLGAAYGFATEISPGPAVPEVESLRRMLGADHLWPIDEVWNFHAGSGGYPNIDVFTAALEARYGAASDVEDYARKAQAMTYEAERAMFEAYGRRKYVATGVVHWLLNNAWPSLIWHLYAHDLSAGGGYYGTKKALEPLHVQYSQDDRAVYVVNSGLAEHRGLTARATVMDLDLTQRLAAEQALDVGPDAAVEAMKLPELGAVSPTYLVRVELRDAAGATLSSNLYWLSTSPDVVDWDHADFFAIPTPAYADLTALAALPSVALEATATPCTAGDDVVRVTVTNPGPAFAFMVRLALTRGPDGAEVLPTRWDDNFFSLLPGETRTVAARFLPEDAGFACPALRVRGWNVASP